MRNEEWEMRNELMEHILSTVSGIGPVVWASSSCVTDVNPYAVMNVYCCWAGANFSLFTFHFSLAKHYFGGYCGGVPPLPIPNREVKPACADGTAMQCGRVGGRLLFMRLETGERRKPTAVSFFVPTPCFSSGSTETSSKDKALYLTGVGFQYYG